jgi:predicted outer membrane repeat protein
MSVGTSLERPLMNPFRRAHVVFLAALVGCGCAAMLALAPREREAASGAGEGGRRGGGDGGVILYVDDDARTGGDGLTWRSAIRFLQDALDAARAPGSGVSEIRIAQGEYKPDQGASVTPGDSFATFWIPAGLTVAGGYAGALEPDPDARDWSLYVTTFNADLLGDDGPLGGFENISDNSVHISRITPGDAASHLNGIRFIRSRAVFSPADNRGGAVNCENGSVVIEDCRFEGNKAGAGGAIGVVNGEATIERCFVSQNQSPLGGAIVLVFGNLTMIDCSIASNSATLAGGAISCGTSHLTATRCAFMLNSSGAANGGAIKGNNLSQIRLNNCVFQDNHGDQGGALNGPVIAEDCDFISNTAVTVGAVDHAGAASSFSRCRFLGNFASYECGGVRGFGGLFVDCLFENNEAFVLEGGAFLGGGTLINCEFRRNRATTTGGAAHVTHASTFVNSTFVANQGGGCGGAMFVSPGVDAELINCNLLANSGAGNGSAVFGAAAVTNSVIWGHAPLPFDQIGPVTFSCIQDGWPGEGNVSGDPMFVDAPGIDGILGTEDDDLRLSAGSPCIDAASNPELPADVLDIDEDGNVTESIPLDLSGGLRLVNDPDSPDAGNSGGLQAVVDMGALEFRDFKMRAGDVNSDGVVNIEDLLAVIGAWGPCPQSPAPPPGACIGDEAPPGGDGVVDILDLMLVIDQWFSR